MNYLDKDTKDINGRGQVKVGENNSGVYIGDALVAGVNFDITQLLSNISIDSTYNNVSDNIPRILIVNLSDNSDTVLYRDTVETRIPAKHIEWYSFNLGATISYVNESDASLQVFQETYLTDGNSYTITYHRLTARSGNIIIDNEFDVNGYQLLTCIVMNDN